MIHIVVMTAWRSMLTKGLKKKSVAFYPYKPTMSSASIRPFALT